MRLLRLIQEVTRGKRFNIILTALLSGIANAGILAIINKVPRSAAQEGNKFFLLILFIITLALYIICLQYTLNVTAQIFEDIVNTIRCKVADKIRTSDLIALDRVGKSRIYNMLTEETTMLASSALSLSAGLQAVLMVIFASVYMAFLSVVGFLVVFVLMSSSTILFLIRRKERIRYMNEASQHKVAFIDSVRHLLDGFKEVRMNAQRSDDVYGHIEDVSHTVNASNIKTANLMAKQYMFSKYFFYICLGVIVFVLPRFMPVEDEVLVDMTAAILFIAGPIGMIVGAANTFTKANHSAELIFALEKELDAHTDSDRKAKQGLPAALTSFEEISLEGAAFSYRENHHQILFSMGPVSLSIEAGEILFIIGGNGSGKSTLLKVLAALYAPDEGTIRVDGAAVHHHNAQPYRELFATIFSDFHLFDRLYGLGQIDEAHVNQLLRQMQLDAKTQFAEDRFTNLDLSTGQRKRLALVVTLLEDKPIFLFDELAADQDPGFRKYLYQEVLPDLKEQGKTIIAVTHDDKYFHVADRIVRMEYGKIEYCLTPDELAQRGGF